MGGPDLFLRLQFSPGAHNLPKATEQEDFTPKYCKDLSSDQVKVLPLPTRTFYSHFFHRKVLNFSLSEEELQTKGWADGYREYSEL